jgi:hypothetical protein
MTRWLLIFGVLLSGTALAEPRIKRARFVDPPPGERKDTADRVASRTRLQVVIGGASPGLRTGDFVAKTTVDDVPVAIAADKSVPFASSDEELAIMILVQGTVRFMGTVDGDDGYFEVVKTAVETIARARTRHTRVGLYVYGATVTAKVPMGPPENVTGAALGELGDYADINTKALQRGFEEGLRVLSQEPARRVLFVIGDGGDQVREYSARRDLEELEAARIEVYALGASPRDAVWADRGRLEAMGRLGAVKLANQKEQVPQLAEVLVNELSSVYTVEFPELQASDGQRLPVDGEEHELTVKAGVEETAEETVRFPGPLACLPGGTVRCVCPTKPPTMGPGCPEPPRPLLPAWAWATMGLALCGAVGGVVWIARRRVDVEEDDDVPPPPPEPVPMFMPMLPAPPPDPRKTVAVRPFVDDGEIPLVAWIVPVSGTAAYQTFRLKERTVIGAGVDCDVRIEDPMMSGRHAEIFLSNGDFVLVDRDSRNGVHFYDKKIARHTLVDNDLFTLGNTSFKFKWTM